MSRTDLLFRLIGLRHSANWNQIQRFVTRFQYADEAEIQAYQIQNLRKVLDHAYANVPFYTRLFRESGLKPRDIQTPSDLARVPIITKETVRTHRSDFLAKNWQDFHPTTRATGGTTGLAFKFYNDRIAWMTGWAVKKRTFSWGGYRLGTDKLAVMAGGSLLPQSKPTLKSRAWRSLMNYHSFPISHMTDDSLLGQATLMRKEGIHHLRGYPTAVYTFAKFLNQQNQTLPLKSIFTTAEMLLPHQRELMLQVFGGEVFDQYGAGDGMGQANECEVHKGLHLTPELNITHIVNKEGREVQSGQEGELVFTSLLDYAMPLIRYKPGDLAIKTDRKCTCGRTAPLIEKIIGRSSDLIELSNGRKINGLSIPFEAWTEKVEKFQIVQTDHDRVELNIVPKTGFSDAEREAARKVMEFHCGPGCQVEVHLCNSIPVPPSGKFRYVISRFNFDHNQ